MYATIRPRIAVLAVLMLTLASVSTAEDSAFTYQGQLRQTGTPFTGTVDLEFRLFDALMDGSEIGSAQQRPDWPIEDGLFQVELDFGIAAFDGNERFLEIRIDGAALNPRQAIRPSPLALFALGGNEGPAGPAGPPGPTGPIGPVGPGFANCQYVQAIETGGTATAFCPSEQNAISGSCTDLNLNTIVASVPFPIPTQNPSPLTAVTGWRCVSESTSSQVTTYALCCDL